MYKYICTQKSAATLKKENRNTTGEDTTVEQMVSSSGGKSKIHIQTTKFLKLKGYKFVRCGNKIAADVNSGGRPALFKNICERSKNDDTLLSGCPTTRNQQMVSRVTSQISTTFFRRSYPNHILILKTTTIKLPGGDKNKMVQTYKSSVAAPKREIASQAHK
ncbi:putative pentatricopeptide repeat-containing protein [Dirofilaria immitis]